MAGELACSLHHSKLPRLFPYLNLIAGADFKRWYVHAAIVHVNVAMPHQLPGLAPRCGETEAVDYVIEPAFKLLQQQFTGANATTPKVLQVSKGFAYTLDLTKTGADRIVTSSITLNGAPLDPAASYRVTVNNFLAGGGDGFAVLTQGTAPLVGEVDLDAFVAFLTAHSSVGSPLPQPTADRITVIS